MGLDVYFTRKNSNGDDIAEQYFRKPNMILSHVEKCLGHEMENCVDHRLEVVHVLELIDKIKVVLADHSKAEEVLPLQSGFFFGGTVYDEYYFDDLEYIRDDLEELMKDHKEDDYIMFHAWW